MVSVWAETLGSSSGAWTGYASRQFASGISGLNGATSTQVRVTFTNGGSGALTANHCSIAIQGSGTAPSTQFAPVELKFSGASGFAALAANASITSDWLSFPFTASDTLMVDIDNGAAGQKAFNTTSVKGHTWFKSASGDYNQTTVSGYTDNGAGANWVSLIEGQNLTYSVTAAKGTFTLTGVAAVLTHAYRALAAVAGSYALTGVATAQKISRATSRGIFTLTGNTASVRSALRFTAATGAFVLTGRAVAQKIVMPAVRGIYAVTGVAIVMAHIAALTSKFKRRIAPDALESRRTTDPTLED